MRVIADRDVCVGAGVCVMHAAAIFDQDDDDGLVVVLDQHPSAEHEEAVREAVANCPSGALGIVED